MKILVIGETNIAPYDKNHFAQIKKVFEEVNPSPQPSPTGGEGDRSLVIVNTEDPKKISRELGSTDIIITSPFHQHLIDLKLAKKLKWVHVSSAGVTDIAKFLAPTKILLTNSSGVHPIPISEHVAAFMLMFARQINRSYRTQIEEKTWKRNKALFDIFEMASATVGIVGLGRIGSRVAQISKGLGAKVVAFEHDKKIKNSMIDHTYKKVGELLKVSDFVVDCLPLTPATEGYFDLKKFKAMNKNSYFINIGRGKTVVERDLIKALKEGLIAAAGLDVFEVEPLPDNSPLWKMENVIITPHVSGWTPEYTNRVVDIFCENLKGFIKGPSASQARALRAGQAMPTLVDKKRGY